MSLLREQGELDTDTADFRRAARAWLDANAAPRPVHADGPWGEGDQSVAVFHDAASGDERRRLDVAIAWQRRKLAAGWGALSIDAALGGRGLPVEIAVAFSDEESQFDVPPMPELLGVTVRLAAPTIDRWGSDAQRQRYVPALLAAELLCCQLFSEPDAGSDLASIGCRAIHHDGPDGGGWTIEGQKVWTSGAPHADVGLAICRSDPGAPKHAGLTAFLIPMDAEGVEVRPIRQMTGGSAFNEIFLSAVEIDDAQRLGPAGSGWKVALTMLGLERMIAGTGMQGIGGSIGRLLALARWAGATADPVLRDRLSDAYAQTFLQELTMDRLAPKNGVAPGVEGSIGKLLWTANLKRIGELAALILGPRITAETGEWGTYCWTEHLLGAPGYRIAGGSDEIQHNILAERRLGLPGEPRAPSVQR